MGSTLFHHIVLTEKFGKQLQEMESLADTMGHDVQTAQGVYIKNVDADLPESDDAGNHADSES